MSLVDGLFAEQIDNSSYSNVGALIGQIGMSYSEKYVGFWLAYLLPTVVFFICPIVLWAGRNRYIRTAPKGSIFGSSWRTFRLAAKGKWSLNPVATYKNFNTPGFWDAAKPSMFSPEERPAWMTHDDGECSVALVCVD